METTSILKFEFVSMKQIGGFEAADIDSHAQFSLPGLEVGDKGLGELQVLSLCYNTTQTRVLNPNKFLVSKENATFSPCGY